MEDQEVEEQDSDQEEEEEEEEQQSDQESDQSQYYQENEEKIESEEEIDKPITKNELIHKKSLKLSLQSQENIQMQESQAQLSQPQTQVSIQPSVQTSQNIVNQYQTPPQFSSEKGKGTQANEAASTQDVPEYYQEWYYTISALLPDGYPNILISDLVKYLEQLYFEVYQQNAQFEQEFKMRIRDQFKTALKTISTDSYTISEQQFCTFISQVQEAQGEKGLETFLSLWNIKLDRDESGINSTKFKDLLMKMNLNADQKIINNYISKVYKVRNMLDQKVFIEISKKKYIPTKKIDNP